LGRLLLWRFQEVVLRRLAPTLGIRYPGFVETMEALIKSIGVLDGS
jgi:hypothetical protein